MFFATFKRLLYNKSIATDAKFINNVYSKLNCAPNSVKIMLHLLQKIGFTAGFYVFFGFFGFIPKSQLFDM
jgi:hypothetical protein